MNAVPALSQVRRDPLAIALRALLALLGASVAALAAAAFFVLGARLVYSGRALPGVSAAGVSLGGQTQAQIEATLRERLTYSETGLIVLRDGERLWVARPIELGVLIDVPTMARRALAVGREGKMIEQLSAQVATWAEGVAITPVVVFDQRMGAAYLERLATGIDLPTLEASLIINGLEVVVERGQIGRRLDADATLQALVPIVARMYDSDLPLVIEETPPLVLDASMEAETARRILSQPFVLSAEGAGPWSIDPSTLAAMIRFTLASSGSGARFEVGLDPVQVALFLEPLAPELERRAENARFRFNDDTRQLDLVREAIIGRALDTPASVEAINAAIRAGQHDVPLVFQTTAPVVGSSATAADLGITENVVAVSTYFAGSSPGRIQNIRTASAAFDGLLIPPGGSLSMSEVLGDISLDSGYAEALIIYNGRTINGVGGGVCQVSTTLFRAVFFGGYQIDERHPHAYRVGYYEQGPGSPGPGMDATVFVPVVDFRFTNDSPHWLLMETYVYGTQLLWKFYSTSDGRVVTWTTSGPRNVVEAPERLYKENLDLPRGEIRQVDYEADGMDVTITRLVTRGGETIHQDTIRTHYLPWRAIYEYGPGTELPPGARTE